MELSEEADERSNQVRADMLLAKFASASYKINQRIADTANHRRLPTPHVIIPPPHHLMSNRRKDHSPEDNEQNNSNLLPHVIPRRPRRANAAPFNYFSKSNYSGYGSGDDGELPSPKRSLSLLGCKEPTASPPAISPRTTKGLFHRIIFQNGDLKICRQSIRNLDDLGDLAHAPYNPRKNPAHYVHTLKPSDSAKTLHVAFDRDEIMALVGILSRDDIRLSSSELALADQLIGILSIIPEIKIRSFTRKAMKTLEVRQLLASHKVDDIEAYLLGIEAKSQDNFTQLHHKCMRFMRKQFNFECNDSGLWTEDARSTIRYIAKCLELSYALRRRHKDDVRTFLFNAKEGNVSTTPYAIKVVPCIDMHRTRKVASHSLRDREMGYEKGRSEYFSNRFRASKYWKGASNDVLNLAWSPDGMMFAVGAAAQCDEHNMQYNRNNNLLLGDVELNTLTELPAHRIPHPSTSSTRDPFLYMSVTSVQWSEHQLFTSSYDGTAKVWDISRSLGATCSSTLKHPSKVHLMGLSAFELLATATETINIWQVGEHPSLHRSLPIVRPKGCKPVDLTPSALAWGLAQSTNRWLAAGSSGNDRENGDPSKEGCLSVWQLRESEAISVNLTPNSQNIFDLKWHPILPCLATGSSVSTLKRAKSVVRLYHPLTCLTRTIEFDCPALDINDVSFCPFDHNYVSASCTDGSTYVWDLRKPDKILHRLKHGKALYPLDENLTREQADVGVRVALWGGSINSFYTAGSDGTLKSWDILRSPDDAHLNDVVNVDDELMCGLFSHDKSQLLLGDAAGGVHLLSTDSQSSSPHLMLKTDDIHQDPVDVDVESGIFHARKLLASGELQQHPTFGVGQGSNYQGPFAAWARPKGTPAESIPVTPLTRQIQALQLDGPAVETRQDLDAIAKNHVMSQIQLAHIRNRSYQPGKRKRADVTVIPIDSDDEEPPFIPRRRCGTMHVERINGTEWIDLTLDSESEYYSEFERLKDSPQSSTIEETWKEKMDEDHWWPEPGSINPNLQE